MGLNDALVREGLALAPLCTRSLGAHGSVFAATISQTAQACGVLSMNRELQNISPRVSSFLRLVSRLAATRQNVAKQASRVTKGKSQITKPVAKCDRKRWQKATLHHVTYMVPPRLCSSASSSALAAIFCCCSGTSDLGPSFFTLSSSSAICTAKAGQAQHVRLGAARQTV